MTELRTKSRFTHLVSRITFHVSRFRLHLRFALLAILLLCLALRAAPLSAHRFHEDEALYASWALLTTEDPALISVPVDKPPLYVYLLAGLFRLLGPSELVARLPNLFASVASVVLLYAIGRRAYDRSTALMAATLHAASPFAVLFAPTAFTDPLLVLWMLLGLWAGLARKPLLAGFALGLAYATKQQAVLLAPLVVAASVLGEGRGERGKGRGGDTERGRHGARSPCLHVSVSQVAGFLPLLGLVTWWDSLRWHVQPSFWDRSLITYGGLEMLPLSAWPQRLADWAKLLSHVFASPLLNGLLLIGLPLLLWLAVHHRRSRRSTHSAFRIPSLRVYELRAAYDLLFILYVVAYLLLHLAVSFQVWDRYLLPLVPLLCLLLARSIRCLSSLAHRLYDRFRVSNHQYPISNTHSPISNIQHPISSLIIGSLLILLIRPAYLGATSQLPVGGDHGAYQGIDHLAAYVRAHLPPGSTLYYHWLGWHYGYYLWDATVETVWYPDPESLAKQAAEDDDLVRAIAFPGWKDDRSVRRALAAMGLALVPQFATHRGDGSPSFALYLIEDEGAVAQSGGVP